jgi:hypothetical protein
MWIPTPFYNIRRLFKKGNIGFTFYRDDRIIGHQWIRNINPRIQGSQKIEMRLELDLSSYYCQRESSRFVREAHIIFEDTGKPLQYKSAGTGGSFNIQIQSDTDGLIISEVKRLKVDVKNCSFIYETNFIGLEWLFLVMHAHDTERIETWFFQVNALLRIPYQPLQ